MSADAPTRPAPHLLIHAELAPSTQPHSEVDSAPHRDSTLVSRWIDLELERKIVGTEPKQKKKRHPVRPKSAKPRLQGRRLRGGAKERPKRLLRRKSFSTNARNRKGGKHDFGARPARLLTANGSILHIYGVRDGDATGQVKNRNQNRPASARRKRKPSQKSKSGNSNQASHQGAGRPWEKMDREEQYMKLIHMRRETMEARNETKLMRTKIARLENKAKKQDEQVETTLSKAAAAITAALSRNHDGMSPTGSSDVNPQSQQSLMDTLNAKLVAKLQKQVKSLKIEVTKREQDFVRLQRDSAATKLNEAHILLDEYRKEISRLRDMLDYRQSEAPGGGQETVERRTIGATKQFKDTIHVLTVQRTHVLKENQRLLDKINALEASISELRKSGATKRKAKKSKSGKSSPTVSVGQNSRIKKRKLSQENNVRTIGGGGNTAGRFQQQRSRP